MHRGHRDIQVAGAAARPVGKKMAGGPPENQEGMPSLGLVRKSTTYAGGVSVSFRKNLSGSGAISFNLWGTDLGVVGGNGQNARGRPCGFPPAGDRQYGETTVGRYLEGGGIGECPQGRGDS